MRRLLCAVAAVLALGACSDPEPLIARPTPSPFTSPAETSATSSPTEVVTSEAPEPLSPEETVRAWVKAFNRAATDGEVDALRRLSAPDCRQCQDAIDQYSAIYRDGGSLVTRGWRVDRLKRRPDFDQTGELAALVRSDRATLRRSATSDPEAIEAENLVMRWTLEPAGSAWLVRELAFLS